MGCGCGGGRRTSGRTVTTTPARNLQAGVAARQIQTQSTQREILAQRAQERLQQQNVNISSLSNNSRNTEIERKRRIQVSLRNRQSRFSGNQ